MWRKLLTDRSPGFEDHQLDDYDALLRYITDLANHKLGYPVSLLTHLGIVDNKVLGIKSGSLANILLNNVGDPFKDSETSRMEVKRHERKLLAMLEKYFGLPEHFVRGYVTTGGTEGNFAGLWWSKRFMINSVLPEIIKKDDEIKQLTREEQELLAGLVKIPHNEYQKRAEHLQKIIDNRDAAAKYNALVQQLLIPTVFYTKDHTHYSIPKIAEILRLNTRPIVSNLDGSMDLMNFKKELLLHLGAHPLSAVIVIGNIGTTITGAIDDVPGIKKILDESQPKPLYTIHLDGALTGFVMPILKPFGYVENYFDSLGVNTLAFSAHKYPGLSQPCGVILARESFFKKAFEKTERSVEYVGNILDVTITGSRSGLNVLMLYNALHALGLGKGNDKLTKMVNENLHVAQYLYDELIKLYGQEKVFYPYHFNVIFPKPSMEIAKKYQLMITGETATICVLTNVTKELVNNFINELYLEKEKIMSTIQTEYTIRTLTDDYINSALELFIKSFCDSEPITRHLNMKYDDYEPFAREVLEKAAKEGMSVIAIDRNNKVIAVAVSEDMANFFVPHLAKYPKMKPIFALLSELDKPFMKGKDFLKGKIAHVSVAVVDSKHRGKGLSTAIDMACGELAVRKGFDFAYAEFTSDVSENITHHYDTYKLCNKIKYEDFALENDHPFKGVKGEATAYIVGLKPGLKLDSLQTCYKEARSH
ncbi:MAG TPA: pyridoxal-dependent decarboxylase [Gammaproteobacteria bacterium]|nr:pyridoxal-dependent decarboxylase [Gammaproteobacteria bacterium]